MNKMNKINFTQHPLSFVVCTGIMVLCMTQFSKAQNNGGASQTKWGSAVPENCKHLKFVKDSTESSYVVGGTLEGNSTIMLLSGSDGIGGGYAIVSNGEECKVVELSTLTDSTKKKIRDLENYDQDADFAFQLELKKNPQFKRENLTAEAIEAARKIKEGRVSEIPSESKTKEAGDDPKHSEETPKEKPKPIQKLFQKKEKTK